MMHLEQGSSPFNSAGDAGADALKIPRFRGGMDR